MATIKCKMQAWKEIWDNIFDEVSSKQMSAREQGKTGEVTRVTAALWLSNFQSRYSVSALNHLLRDSVDTEKESR